MEQPTSVCVSGGQAAVRGCPPRATNDSLRHRRTICLSGLAPPPGHHGTFRPVHSSRPTPLPLTLGLTSGRFLQQTPGVPFLYETRWPQVRVGRVAGCPSVDSRLMCSMLMIGTPRSRCRQCGPLWRAGKSLIGLLRPPGPVGQHESANLVLWRRATRTSYFLWDLERNPCHRPRSGTRVGCLMRAGATASLVDFLVERGRSPETIRPRSGDRNHW